MSNFPQDIYARNLLSHRGYPLWTPEPHIELPDSYQRGGLKIGDIGVVVPEDGSFDVFFNITLPREHPLHAPDGVPVNFSPIELKREDYRIAPDAESPGRVISSSSVECTVSCVDPFNLDGKSRSLTDHQFSLCRNEGAMLILPEGAERHRLAKELLLLDVIIQNAVDWYRFARERLYRNIRNDALYLITGFHKAPSWSLASFQDTGGSSARCKLVQLSNGGPILTTHSTWETVRPLEWRIGPRHSHGTPNQSVFITGFKIAVKEDLFHLKRVTVKVEHTKRTLTSRLVGFGASLANVLVGGTTEEVHSAEVDTRNETMEQVDKDGEVIVERVPHMPEAFHPSDVINNYLLAKEPSAKVAVTHDGQWINLLERGVLTQDELVQEGRLEAVVSREYRVVTRDAVVYLENKGPEMSWSSNNSDIIPDSERISVPEWSGQYTASRQPAEPVTRDSCNQKANQKGGSLGERNSLTRLRRLEMETNLDIEMDSLPFADREDPLLVSPPAHKFHIGQALEDVTDQLGYPTLKNFLGTPVTTPMLPSPAHSGSSWQPCVASSTGLVHLEPLSIPYPDPAAILDDSSIPSRLLATDSLEVAEDRVRSATSLLTPHRLRSTPFAPREPVASEAMLEANSRRRRHPTQFECEVCGQTFTALFSLKRHAQSHTSERPFACSIPGCSQRFFSESDCKRHEKSKKRHKDLVTQSSSGVSADLHAPKNQSVDDG